MKKYFPLFICMFFLASCGGSSSSDSSTNYTYTGSWTYEATCTSSSGDGCAQTLHSDTYLEITDARFSWYLNDKSTTCIHSATLTGDSGSNPYTLSLYITGNDCAGQYLAAAGKSDSVVVTISQDNTLLYMTRGGSFDKYGKR